MAESYTVWDNIVGLRDMTPEEKAQREKDVKEWSMSDQTIDKYKERYKELWREKLDEVVKRMMDKI